MNVPSPSVRIRAIPARAGLNWIRHALRAFAKQPGGFMGMFGLYFAVMILFSLPVSLLMPLATLLHLDLQAVAMLCFMLMPLLTLSFMLSTEAVTNDLRIRPALFFEPLRASAAARRSLAALGLVYVAVCVIAWYAGNGLDNGETLKWFNSVLIPRETDAASAAAALAPLSDTAHLVIALKMTLVALGTIPLWHAPALVQWGRYGAAKAMFASVVALWRTRAAMLVFGLGWFALSFVVTAVLGVLELVLGGGTLMLFAGLLVSWMFSALFYVTLWFGFVDTFDIRPVSEFRTVMAEGEPPAPR